MLKFLGRALAQVYKNLVPLRRNPYKLLVDIIATPILLFLTIALFLTYIRTDRSYIDIMILGVVGSSVVDIVIADIVASFTYEYWSRALPHFMISHATMVEFVAGNAISGVLKAALVIAVSLAIAYAFFGMAVSDWPDFLMGLALLAGASVSLGFVFLGFSFFRKEESFDLALILPSLFTLATGAYFPVWMVYPPVLAPLLAFIPSTYAFDIMRGARYGLPELAWLAGLTLAWVLIGYLFNKWMLKRAKDSGHLARFG